MPASTWITNGSGDAVLRAGNRVSLGGAFTYMGPSTGPGLPVARGTVAAIEPFPRLNGMVRTAGSVYAGGTFTQAGSAAVRLKLTAKGRRALKTFALTR